MRILTLVALLLLSFTSSLYSSITKVSEEWGYDAMDATSFLQSAFNDTHAFDTVIIDNVGAWNTGPLFIYKSNLTIILESGTMVTALPGAFSDPGAKLIRIRDVSDIAIIGYGATLAMQKMEYEMLDDGEFRHVISMNGASNITIKGLEIRDSGGDGIFVGPGFLIDEQKFSSNILISDCFIDNNYRQGISVTSAQNCIIENCLITNTNGTLPQSGIDFEPSQQFHRIVNCVVRNCRITNNAGRGIQNGFGQLDSNSTSVSISIEDTYIANNGWGNPIEKGGAITLSTDSTGVLGTINISKSIIEDQPYYALYTQSTPEKITVTLDNVVIKNVANDTSEPLNFPIATEINYSRVEEPWGGIDFKDVFIYDEENRPFFSAIGFFGPDRFLKDITGDISVINPEGVSADYGPEDSQINVTLNIDTLMSMPQPIITPDALNPLTDEGGIEGVFSIFKSGYLDVPTGIKYQLNGTAFNRLDYPYDAGIAVLPAGQLFLEIAIAPRVDDVDEAIETVELMTLPDTTYVINAPETPLITINGTALPLDWGPIMIDDINCSPRIIWKTYNEVNVSHFTVESSSDGKNWQTVSSLIPPGSISYTWKSTFALSQKTYFRIVEHDLNGEIFYAPIVSFIPACENTTAVFPTLTEGILNYKINNPNKEIQIRIHDMKGRVVKQHSAIENFGTIDISQVVPGIYIVNMIDKQQVIQTYKIIKK